MREFLLVYYTIFLVFSVVFPFKNRPSGDYHRNPAQFQFIFVVLFRFLPLISHTSFSAYL